MRLRASYPTNDKKATLIHELGHRFIARRVSIPQDLDAHKVLYLILYDVWVKLYGKSFADEAVEVEKTRTLADYEGAWKWALALSPEQRTAKFRELAGGSR